MGDTWGDYRGTLLGTPKPRNINEWGDWGHFAKNFFYFFYFYNYIYPKKSLTTHQQHNNNTITTQ